MDLFLTPVGEVEIEEESGSPLQLGVLREVVEIKNTLEQARVVADRHHLDEQTLFRALGEVEFRVAIPRFVVLGGCAPVVVTTITKVFPVPGKFCKVPQGGETLRVVVFRFLDEPCLRSRVVCLRQMRVRLGSRVVSTAVEPNRLENFLFRFRL